MKFMASLLLILSVLTLPGCVTIGPKVEKRTVYVRTTDSQGRPLKIGVVAQQAKVKADLTTKSGDIVTEEVDIGGWSITPPEDGPPK